MEHSVGFVEHIVLFMEHSVLSMEHSVLFMEHNVLFMEHNVLFMKYMDLLKLLQLEDLLLYETMEIWGYKKKYLQNWLKEHMHTYGTAGLNLIQKYYDKEES